MGFNGAGVENPLKVYLELEEIARDEIIANGGSISHHHGVGKIRKKWIPQTISKTGIDTLITLKKSIDPQNILASGNIFSDPPDPEAQDGM